MRVSFNEHATIQANALKYQEKVNQGSVTFVKVGCQNTSFVELVVLALNRGPAWVTSQDQSLTPMFELDLQDFTSCKMSLFVTKKWLKAVSKCMLMLEEDWHQSQRVKTLPPPLCSLYADESWASSLSGWKHIFQQVHSFLTRKYGALKSWILIKGMEMDC